MVLEVKRRWKPYAWGEAQEKEQGPVEDEHAVADAVTVVLDLLLAGPLLSNAFKLVMLPDALMSILIHRIQSNSSIQVQRCSFFHRTNFFTE